MSTNPIEDRLAPVLAAAERPASRRSIVLTKIRLAEARYARGQFTGRFGAQRSLNDARDALGNSRDATLRRRIDNLAAMLAKHL